MLQNALLCWPLSKLSGGLSLAFGGKKHSMRLCTFVVSSKVAEPQHCAHAQAILSAIRVLNVPLYFVAVQGLLLTFPIMMVPVYEIVERSLQHQVSPYMEDVLTLLSMPACVSTSTTCNRESTAGIYASCCVWRYLSRP